MKRLRLLSLLLLPLIALFLGHSLNHLSAQAESPSDQPLQLSMALVPSQSIQQGTHTWIVLTIDLRQQALHLVGQSPEDPHGFSGLEPWAKRHNTQILAATNAGIFESITEPSGLWVSEGQEQHPRNLSNGYGNFFLRPNGIFFIDPQGAHIVPSDLYTGQDVELATQSGPLLVSKGMFHPKLDPQSHSRTSRNGVGLKDPHTLIIAWTADGATLYDMATLFRDQLGCPDALYLDGSISGLCLPGVACGGGKWAGMLVVTPKE